MTTPIKIGVLGTGFGAKVALPVYATAEGFEPVAIWSRRRDRANEVAKQFGVPVATDQFEDILATPGLEAVHVATPVALHAPMMEAAAQHGLHLICEKPVASDLSEARRIAAAVQQAGIVAVVDFELRMKTSRRALLNRGRQLGQIRMMNLSLVQSDHATSSSRPFTWVSDAAMGGGRLQAYGVHDIDFLLQLADVAEICAATDIAVKERLAPDGELRLVTGEDAYAVVARLVGGGLAVLSLVSTAAHRRGDRIEIYGESGTAVLDDDGFVWSAGPDSALTSEGPFDDDFDAAFREVARDFYEAVRNGGTVHPSLEDGLRAQAVLDAVRTSAAGGGWVAPAPP